MFLNFVFLISAILMTVILAIQLDWYSINKRKCWCVSFALIVSGIVGSKIWFFVENGEWGGKSFYGAIFLTPVVFILIAKLMRIDYLLSLDFVPAAGCLTLALVKLQCLRDNCCQGMVLYIDENRIYVRFPSQITEMIVFLLLSVVFLVMSKNPKNRKTLFPWFLVLYGGSRFFLDFLRDTMPAYLFGLSAGSFWSACAFIIGVTWLIVFKKLRKNNV